MFEKIPTPIAGLVVLRPRTFEDRRGQFVKTYHAEAFEQVGCGFRPVEEFFSVSGRNVLRGMHFQVPPAAHHKLVYCITGRALDVVLDLRTGSPTFGKTFSRELSATSREQLFIPIGLAHGFLSLDDRTTMLYLTSHVHSPAHDAGVRWDSFGFEWPTTQPEISDRDRQFPALADFQSPF